MKASKELIIVIIVAILFSILVSCKSVDDGKDALDIPMGENYEIIAQETFEMDNSYTLIIYTIVDTDTGVMYSYVRGGIYGGGLTPIYNADGTLKIYREENGNA